MSNEKSGVTIFMEWRKWWYRGFSILIVTIQCNQLFAFLKWSSISPRIRNISWDFLSYAMHLQIRYLCMQREQLSVQLIMYTTKYLTRMNEIISLVSTKQQERRIKNTSSRITKSSTWHSSPSPNVWQVSPSISVGMAWKMPLLC